MKFYCHPDFWQWLVVGVLTIFITGRCAWVMYRAFIWVTQLASGVQ